MRHRPLLNQIMLLIVLVVSVTGQAYCTEVTEWSPEVARLLMADGWEVPIPDAPLILYGLRIVELEDAALRHLDLISKGASSVQAREGWQVSVDPSLLRFVAREYADVSLSVDLHNDHDKAARQVTAWLGTTPKKPVVLSFKQQSIGREDRQARLELKLLPTQVNSSNGRIQTEVVLESLSVNGHLAQANFTVWIEPDATQPVAVITVTEEGKRSAKRRYFALFLSGQCLSSENYPAEFGAMPLTDVSDFSLLFDEFLGKTAGPQALHHELKAKLSNYDQGLGYEGQYIVSLAGGLGAVLNASGSFDGPPVIMLGAYDKVPWTDNITVHGVLLPLVWDVKGGRLDTQLNYELGLDYQLDHWSLGLAFGRIQSKNQYIATIKYIPKEYLGLEAGIGSRGNEWIIWIGLILRQ